MYEAILFDVDGTLLSISGREMMKEYLGRLAKYFDPLTDGQGLAIVQTVQLASAAMEKNPGGKSNEQLFWEIFEQHSDFKRAELEPQLEIFYAEEFPKVGHLAGDNGVMPEVVKVLAQKGYPLVVATNPVFPLTANKARLAWAKVDTAPWQEITSFEHYSHCKPDPRFFTEICQRVGASPEKCLMIGNGLIDDVAAVQAGLEVYLVTDEVKDGKPEDYNGPKGTREALLAFVQALADYQPAAGK